MPTPQLMIDTIELLKANTTYALPAAAVQLSWQSGTGSAILVSIDGTNFSTLGTSTGLEVKTVNTAAIFLKTSTPGTRIVAKPSPALIIPDPLTIGRINITDQLHLTNSSKITATNTAGTGDMTVVSFGPTDAIKIGDDTTVSGIQLHAINTIGLWAGGGAFKWATDISGAWFPGTTNAYDIGLAASNHVRNIYLDGAVIIGTNPASIGAIRLANSGIIYGRNAANTGDVVIAYVHSDNGLRFGDVAAKCPYIIANTGIWTLPDNTNDFGIATGRWRSAYLGTSLSIGTNPATTGAIRLANNIGLYARNAANSADVTLISIDTNNDVFIGQGGSLNVKTGGHLSPVTSATYSLGTPFGKWVDLYLTNSVQIGTNPATIGAIRLANNQGIYFRNFANSADIWGLIVDNNNNMIFGYGANSMLVYTHVYAQPDASFDLGNAGQRFRNLFLSSSVVNKVKAGTPVDADVTAPADGMMVLDSTANKIWVRLGGTWKGVVVS